MSKQLPVVRITKGDMELFAAASGDRNPLHVSPEYARRTPFGRQVVFGVLGGLAALGQLPDRDDAEPEAISLEFKAPLAIDSDYVVERATDAHVRLLEFGATALDCSIVFRPAKRRGELAELAPTGRTDPANRSLDSLERATAAGYWAPSAPALDALLTRFGLRAKGFDAAPVAALLWTSYLAGMELPGERSLLWRIELRFDALHEAAATPFKFEASVARHDARVEVVDVVATLATDAGPFATASVRAFVRPDPIRPDPVLLPRSTSLAGKVGVVVGGSRGFGASLAQALALAGAQVLVVYRDSGAEAESMQAAAEHIELVRGDAADAQWCRDALQPRAAELGGVDLLVCNASPPIRALRLVPDALAALTEFVDESVRLVAAPVAAFLPELAARKGTLVLISSSAVAEPPSEWPHYVTAKAGVEGLADWVAANHPAIRVLVVRPPKLLTDQMNTLLGRRDASRVEPIAAEVVAVLSEAPQTTGVELVAPG